MNIDTWWDHYKPIRNPNNDNGWDGCLFETYGEDIEFVMNQPTSHVWTWVDGETGTYLLSGYHYVNRIGYLICENEETHDTEILVDEYEMA